MHTPGNNTRSRLGGLIALNAALLAVLAVVTFAPGANAQHRSRGKYAMVTGGVTGSLSSVVYIVDTANQELIALSFDPSAKRLKGVGYRNIESDAGDVTRRGVNP